MSDNRREALEALRDKVKAGETGWAAVSPFFFEDRKDLLTFLSGTRAQNLKMLDRLISETPKGETP